MEFPPHGVCSTRHSRARGNPGLFSRALAWIPAFAGMTDPCGLLVARIIAAQVFSMEITKDTKVADGIVSELRALRVLRGQGEFPAYFVPLIPNESMMPAMRLVSSSINFL